MGIVDEIRRRGATYRLTEEALYAEALRECEAGIRRDGLWAKALAKSGMRQGEAQAYYLKLRVQSLRDEINLVLQEIEQKRSDGDAENEITGKVREINQSGTIEVDLPVASNLERTAGGVALGIVLVLIAFGFFSAQDWLIQLGFGFSMLWLIWWLRRR